MPNQRRKPGAPPPPKSERVPMSAERAQELAKQSNMSAKELGNLQISAERAAELAKTTGRSANSLRSWQPGRSGNPSGKSASLNAIMRQAREHAPEVIEKLLAIVRDPKAAHRDVIQAGLAILDRGLGKPIVPAFRSSGTNLPDEMILGSEGNQTPLLTAANGDTGAQYRRALKAELDRLDREEVEAKKRNSAQMDAARKAKANGETLDGPMKMLLEVTDAKH